MRRIRNLAFPGSARYWENRYRYKGNSGNGSYGKNAAYKAGFLNQFVADNQIAKIIEFGCGDGNQLKQFHFSEYFGLDVSPTAIQLCRSIFQNDKTKQFYLSGGPLVKEHILNFKADLSLSLDVIFHLVEDGFQNFSKVYPFILLFTPLVFYYPIRPDCELQTSLGHLVKSCFLIYMMLLFWRKDLSKIAEKRTASKPNIKVVPAGNY